MQTYANRKEEREVVSVRTFTHKFLNLVPSYGGGKVKNMFAEIHKIFPRIMHKMFAEIQKMFAEIHKMFAEIDKMFTEMHKMFAEIHKIFPEIHKMFAEMHKSFPSSFPDL